MMMGVRGKAAEQYFAHAEPSNDWDDISRVEGPKFENKKQKNFFWVSLFRKNNEEQLWKGLTWQPT